MNTKLAILISLAMFVLVIDTSIMNVSIKAISQDLNTNVSNVQAIIALEALVSAAFILIGGKVADLIGRKRAYTLGLLGYGLGAAYLLGDLRRTRCFASFAFDAGVDPRKLRGPCS
jgi:MFS family permease